MWVIILEVFERFFFCVLKPLFLLIQLRKTLRHFLFGRLCFFSQTKNGWEKTPGKSKQQSSTDRSVGVDCCLTLHLNEKNALSGGKMLEVEMVLLLLSCFFCLCPSSGGKLVPIVTSVSCY